MKATLNESQLKAKIYEMVSREMDNLLKEEPNGDNSAPDYNNAFTFCRNNINQLEYRGRLIDARYVRGFEDDEKYVELRNEVISYFEESFNALKDLLSYTFLHKMQEDPMIDEKEKEYYADKARELLSLKFTPNW
jgi:hypothetical protein